MLEIDSKFKFILNFLKNMLLSLRSLETFHIKILIYTDTLHFIVLSLVTGVKEEMLQSLTVLAVLPYMVTHLTRKALIYVIQGPASYLLTTMMTAKQTPNLILHLNI